MSPGGVGGVEQRLYMEILLMSGKERKRMVVLARGQTRQVERIWRRFKKKARRRHPHFKFCFFDATIIFQEMPKRSTTIPYRSAKNVFTKWIWICPPSLRAAKNRSAFSGVSARRRSE